MPSPPEDSGAAVEEKVQRLRQGQSCQASSAWNKHNLRQDNHEDGDDGAVSEVRDHHDAAS